MKVFAESMSRTDGGSVGGGGDSECVANKVEVEAATATSEGGPAESDTATPPGGDVDEGEAVVMHGIKVVRTAPKTKVELFTHMVGNVAIHFQLIQMENCNYIWAGVSASYFKFFSPNLNRIALQCSAHTWLCFQ
jgi:hypothetical protein